MRSQQPGTASPGRAGRRGAMAGAAAGRRVEPAGPGAGARAGLLRCGSGSLPVAPPGRPEPPSAPRSFPRRLLSPLHAGHIADAAPPAPSRCRSRSLAAAQRGGTWTNTAARRVGQVRPVRPRTLKGHLRRERPQVPGDGEGGTWGDVAALWLRLHTGSSGRGRGGAGALGGACVPGSGAEKAADGVRRERSGFGPAASCAHLNLAAAAHGAGRGGAGAQPPDTPTQGSASTSAGLAALLEVGVKGGSLSSGETVWPAGGRARRGVRREAGGHSPAEMECAWAPCLSRSRCARWTWAPGCAAGGWSSFLLPAAPSAGARSHPPSCASLPLPLLWGPTWAGSCQPREAGHLVWWVVQPPGAKSHTQVRASRKTWPCFEIGRAHV